MDINEIKELTQKAKTEQALSAYREFEETIKYKARNGDSSCIFNFKGSTLQCKDELIALFKEDGFDVEHIHNNEPNFCVEYLIIKWK